MRRRREEVEKLKVKVIEAVKEGHTYQEIREKYGVSPSSIAKWTKGKDLRRYCKQCGETDPAKLEEHHPDREKLSDHTVTLCANCHSKITRKQASKRNKGQEKPILQKTVEAVPQRAQPIQVPTPYYVHQPFPPVSSTVPLLTPEQWRWVAQWIPRGIGGVIGGEAVFAKNLSWGERAFLLALAGCFFWSAETR